LKAHLLITGVPGSGKTTALGGRDAELYLIDEIGKMA